MRTPRLGQHFLTSRTVLTAIVKTAALTPHDTVLEIGPGKGVLTKKLLEKGCHVLAIEKDEELFRGLENRFKGAIADGQLNVIHADIRSVNVAEYGIKEHAYKLVANIPYYITGEILRRFLAGPIQPHHIVLLVQKEIAERIARSTKESVLSLAVKTYGTPHYVQTVKKTAFQPAPAIDSAILAITDISHTNLQGIEEHFFFSLIKHGFAQKRKRLQRNLTTIAPAPMIERAFKACKLSRDVRAEDLSFELWRCLAHKLKK